MLHLLVNNIFKHPIIQVLFLIYSFTYAFGGPQFSILVFFRQVTTSPELILAMQGLYYSNVFNLKILDFFDKGNERREEKGWEGEGRGGIEKELFADLVIIDSPI